MKLRIVVNLLLSLTVPVLCGCAQQGDISRSAYNISLAEDLGPQAESRHLYKNSDWQELWDDLEARLLADGFAVQNTDAWFQRLDLPPSLSPMGTKVRELYTSKFLPKKKEQNARKGSNKKTAGTSLAVPRPWFKDVVTTANARRCLDFIKQHQVAFIDAENRYRVPREVAAALLFVETRLGSYMGKDSAFYALASMSVIRSPEAIPYHLRALPRSYLHLSWIQGRMEEKADWAYKELKALLKYCLDNDIDPLTVRGSMYGAIGMCQFMPSNLPRYAADGDADGRIDIFQAPDAIASLCRYLSMHGWSEVMTLDDKVGVLLRYNNMRKYAYTILALARTMEQIEGKRIPIKPPKRTSVKNIRHR